MHRRSHSQFARFFALALSAAGMASAQTITPIADAGTPQYIRTSGQTVRLEGTRSVSRSGSSLVYGWSFVSVPPGSAATLSDPSAAEPTFLADLPGDYVAQLIVSDAGGQSEAAQVKISTQPPAPVAIAGESIHAAPGTTVTLNGSGSWDPAGRRLRFSWTFVSRPAGSVAALHNAHTPFPSFVPDVDGDYAVSLSVSPETDRSGDSAPASGSAVTTVSTLAAAPHARPSVKSAPGGSYVLDGSPSTDPNGLPLHYNWTLLSKPAASRTALRTRSGVFSAVHADVPGTYVVQLTVDNGAASDYRTAVVRYPESAALAVSAGPHRHVAVGDSVPLNGAVAGTSEPATWSFTFLPHNSHAVIDRGAFTVDTPGDYVVQAMVTDGGRSRVSTVLISTDLAFPVSSPAAIADPQANTVRLYGDSSTDPAGSPLTYRWSVLSASGSTPSLQGETLHSAVLQAVNSETLVAQLQVRNARFTQAATVASMVSSFSLSPTQGAQGTTQTVTITGPAPLLSAITGVDFGAGITVQSFLVSSSQATATILIADTAAAGARNVTLSTLGSSVTLSGGYSVSAGALSITSITPPFGYVGKTTTVTITGELTHFAAGQTQVTLGPAPGIAVPVTVTDPHTLTATINAPVGSYDVTVATGTEVATLKAGFEVRNPPSVASLSVKAMEYGAETNVLITGNYTHFTASSVVTFDQWITARVVSSNSSTQLLVDIAVNHFASYGPHAFTIVTGLETVSGTLQVANPLTALSPASADQGTNFPITLSSVSDYGEFGSVMQDVEVYDATGNPSGVGLTRQILALGQYSVQVPMTILNSATPGLRNIFLTIGNQNYAATGQFTVTPGSPRILSISASSIAQGATLQNVLIACEDIDMTSPANIYFGPGITVSNFVSIDLHHFTVTLAAAGNATLGARTVTVTNTANASASTTNPLFLVTPPALTLSPAALEFGATHDIAVYDPGTHFVAGTTTADFGPGVHVNSVTVLNGSNAIVNITVGPVPAIPPQGPMTVVMTTGSEIVFGSFTLGLPITLSQNTAPQGMDVIETVTVASSKPYWISYLDHVSHVMEGAVTLPGAPSNLLGASFSFTIDTGMLNPGTGSFSFLYDGVLYLKTDAFTVTPGSLQILSVTPAQARQGTQVNVTITGDLVDFYAAPPVINLGPGITLSNIQVVNASTLTATAQIAAWAPAGTNYVSVATGNRVANLNNGFTVVPYGLYPQYVNPKAVVDFQIAAPTPTFNSTTTVTDFTGCSSGGSLTFNSPTSLTWHATISSTIATPSTCGLRIVTPGTPNISYDYSVVDLAYVDPSASAAGSNPLVDIFSYSPSFGTTPWTGCTADFGPGVTAVPLGYVGAQLQFQLTIDPSAAPGPRNVVIDLGEGYVLAKVNGFMVTAPK